MPTLVAIGYPDETTAAAAADEAHHLARHLIIDPDAIAAIRRDADGRFHVRTSHSTTRKGVSWGMYWGLLFGVVYFIPVLGMAVGAGLGALIARVRRSGVDRDFQDRLRDLVQPGTSALFLILDSAKPDEAVASLSRFGGTVLESSLSAEAEAELQDALHGSAG
jgi:uncharacterized membrane protein